MHGQRADGGGEDGQTELPAEELEARVGRGVGADGVHVHEDLLPGVVVAGGAVAGTLGAGAGHGIAAGLAVAHRAGLAIGAYISARFFEYVLVIPDLSSLICIMYNCANKKIM